MKRSQWILKLALAFALCGVMADSTAVLAGNVTFVRSSTGNSQEVGKTILTVIREWGNIWDYYVVNDAVDADIPDGLPSVIAPLTADGDISVPNVDAYYTGEVAGTFDHQDVIDHTGESTFHEIVDLAETESPYIGVRSTHFDTVNGNLDVLIDGDAIQFIDLTLEWDWQAAGMTTGDGFIGFSGFTYTIGINVFRNGVRVAQINGNGNGVSGVTQDGLSHGFEMHWAEGTNDADFGSMTLDDHFGFWAADGDQITYQVNITCEHDDRLQGVAPGDAELIADGLFNWRFAMEDSHLD